MKTALEFLCEEYEATPEDLQLHIALNPDVKRIEKASNAYAQQFRSQPETEKRKLILECLEKYEGNGHNVVAEQIEIALRSQPEKQSIPEGVPTDEDIHEMACEYVAQMEPCSSNAQLHALEEFTQGAAKMRSRMLSIAKEREILFGKFVRENAGLFGKNSDKNIEQLHDLYLSTKTPTTKP